MALTMKVAAKYGRKVAGALSLASLSLGTAFAQSTPEQGIADALLTILAIVAVAGAGYLAVSGASVGWSVGAKFIKRLGGKA